MTNFTSRSARIFQPDGLLRWSKFLGAVLASDALAKVRYGWAAPVKFQRLYVDPQELRESTKRRFRQQTGNIPQLDHRTIIDGKWDIKSKPVDMVHPSVELARLRVLSGKSWTEIGEIDRVSGYLERYGVIDGISTQEQILERYAQLDKLIAELERSKRLRGKNEIYRFHFREWDGINIMITELLSNLVFWDRHAAA